MAKLPQIRLNLDFYSKGRNLRFFEKHGFESIAILQCVWIASSQEKNCRISEEDIFAQLFLKQFEEKKLRKILDEAVEVGLLEKDGAFYFNSQIVSDFKNFEVKRKNYKKGWEKRERIHDESIKKPERNQEKTRMVRNESDTDTESDTDLNPKRKEKSTKTNYLQLPSWVTEDSACHKSLLDWIRQRAERKKPVSQLALERNLKAYENQPKRLYAALEHSIKNDYQGIYEPSGNGSSGKTTSADRTLQAAQNVIAKWEEYGN